MHSTFKVVLELLNEVPISNYFYFYESQSTHEKYKCSTADLQALFWKKIKVPLGNSTNLLIIINNQYLKRKSKKGQPQGLFKLSKPS